MVGEPGKGKQPNDRGSFEGLVIRTDLTRERHEDVVNPLTTYVGYPLNDGLPSSTGQWQIYRLVRQSDILIKEFPIVGDFPSTEYQFKWDDRASLTYPSGAAPSPIPGSSDLVATPQIFNITPALINTEFSQAIPDGVFNCMIKARGAGAAIIRLGFNAGDTATGPYFTFTGASNYEVTLPKPLYGAVFYLRVDTLPMTIEIVTYR